jgi:hypothetical protein
MCTIYNKIDSIIIIMQTELAFATKIRNKAGTTRNTITTATVTDKQEQE